MRQVTKIPQPGDTSQNVCVMKEALNEKGVGPQLDIKNPFFGDTTKTAVSRFQKSVGLAGSGVPAEKTMAALGISVVDVVAGRPTTGIAQNSHM